MSRIRTNPINLLHSWPSSSPWAQSWWKSQACPSWRTVPFQQVKELCKAILEPGDVPRGHIDRHMFLVNLGGFRHWLKANGKIGMCHGVDEPWKDCSTTYIPKTCRDTCISIWPHSRLMGSTKPLIHIHNLLRISHSTNGSRLGP